MNRRKVCSARLLFETPRLSRESNENTSEVPITNRNVGKTRSVGVQPFQSECLSGQYAYLPPLFTRIMNAIVIPRRTSSETNRFVVVSAGCSTETDAIYLPVSKRKRLANTLLASLQRFHRNSQGIDSRIRRAKWYGPPRSPELFLAQGSGGVDRRGAKSGQRARDG